MLILQLLLFVLPLGLDTLGISISLGMKSYGYDSLSHTYEERASSLPPWLPTAILFSLAEMLMPIIGLVIGYAASLIVSSLMHYVGALLLIGVGLWELREEGLELLNKRKKQEVKTHQHTESVPQSQRISFQWGQQLLLALSISLDELAIGFSLGSVSSRGIISPITLCILIGIQGFFMTIIGLSLGRTLRTRLKPLKEWSELLSAFLLIGLGIWLLVS
jgi:putative Mn2+ efflux pump MntP